MEDAMAGIRPIKITVVGDGFTGKTCLLITYTTKEFPETYIPTVFENYNGFIKVDGWEYNMALWDTAGQEEYDRLRPLSYPHTDCFLLCYSINSRSSYENVCYKWIREISHYCPMVPRILVATKCDLRIKEPAENLITLEEGKKLKAKIKAVQFLECSALEGTNLEKVFVEAIRATTVKQKPKKTICMLL